MAHILFKSTCPAGSLVNSFIYKVDFQDSYAFKIPDADKNIEEIYVKIFNTAAPSWIVYALRLRNAIVAPFGLITDFEKNAVFKLEEGKKAGIFTVYKIAENEIIAGEDDRHLNFRVSVHKSTSNPATITVSTLVHYNNLFGRFYMTVVAPFHKMVVKSLIKSSLKRF